jgi:hypothetical protein
MTRTLRVYLDDKELQGVRSLELVVDEGDLIKLRVELFVEVGDAEMRLPMELRTKAE